MKPHVPVLLKETFGLIVRPGESAKTKTIVDMTLGTGGFTEHFLSRGARVMMVDRDPSQVTTVERLTKQYSHLLLPSHVPCRWSELKVEQQGFADAVVMDLGLCTTQLDQKERGFSFKGSSQDALDMRMDSSRGSITAAQVLNTWSEADLLRIFVELAQEPLARAKALAARVVKLRQTTPFSDVASFARLVRSEKVGLVPKHLDPATLPFQALRMVVNDEVNELVQGLHNAQTMLKPGGVAVVISYHSIEDRIVKKFFQLTSKKEDIPPSFIVGKEIIRPEEEEVQQNPRSSSAILRYAYRTENVIQDVRDKLSRLALKRRV